MEFEGFSFVDFSLEKGSLPGPPGGCVHIFCWVADGVENLLYVGQTRRFLGRMNDYRLANFTACTDFHVGEAVRYPNREQCYRVIVRYKLSEDSPKEEAATIRSLLLKGVRLLNCLPGYDCQKADKAEGKKTVQSFCDMLTETHAKATSGN